MRVLGINAIGHHEASACLLDEGRLVAFAEEERFTRTKHAVAQQPFGAVRWCLEASGLDWGDIAAIATPWVEEEYGVIAPPGYREDIAFSSRDQGRDADRWPANLRDFVRGAGCPPARTPALVQVSHHLAHAASAYYCAGFDDAVVLVADGEGDRVSTTLAHGRDGRITLLRQFPTTDSLGQFYACITEFLGMGGFGEGKLMGLAPYGSPRLAFPEIQLTDGGYRIAIDGHLRPWDPAGTDYLAIIKAWMTTLSRRLGSPRPPREAGGPSRLADWPQFDLDVAASAQQTLETVLTHLARAALAETGSRHLVVAGGVGLNCSANGALAGVPGVEAIFVQPAAGDNGAPIGAAQYAAALGGDAPMHQLRSVALGPHHRAAACAAALDAAGVAYTEPADVADEVAERLARGEVVCWFDGAMEGGPRALGGRSIVAAPSSARLRDRVNDVKRRAHWRPLAPSIRAEDSDALLARGGSNPFMIVADHVAPAWHERVPGIVHVDASARPQTVERELQPSYWAMIDGFHRRTGVPAVINTSFNDEREPIVNTPREALATFLRSGADALRLGPFLVTRPDGPGSHTAETEHHR
ncbi:carbamoyltransferase C-terminal domain-containing protein [Actinoplanes sp. NPDC026619]|uniref:carbamoyltransferase family protein n=1 Tax=Actinoplanes sp. NPDC026619 TaxID=3155798 RepID=UPI0033DCD3BE